jgi:hypothetical protein
METNDIQEPEELQEDVAEIEPEDTEPEEIPNDEIMGAIDAELSEDPAPELQLEAVEPEAEAEPAAEPEAEPEAEPALEAEAEAEPAAEPEPEPAAEPEPELAAASRPSDEFGELEKDAPQKTRDRFETLKAGYDEVVAERDAVRTESEGWVTAIKGTGTNQEQFSIMLEYLEAINSGTHEGKMLAWEYMKNEFETLSQQLGKPATNIFDPLTDHKDLQEKVSEGALSVEDAHELAQARATQLLNASQAKEQASKGQQEQAVQTALADVKTLGEQLKVSDPSFDSKMPYLTPIIQSIVKAAPNNPGGWRDAIFEAYSNLPAMQAAPSVRELPPAPNPIRPGGPGPANSDLNKEPGNINEAVDLALSRGF